MKLLLDTHIVLWAAGQPEKLSEFNSSILGGRETARHLGLRYIGLIGALVMAKRKGLINAVKPHLDMLDHSC